MKKVFIFFFTLGIIICLCNVYVNASDVTPTEVPSPTPTPEINDYYKLPLVRSDSYNINNMIRYYHEVLTEDQQKITRFLIGTYNYMYLTARGFTYEDVEDLDDYIEKFDEFAAFIVGFDSNYIETNSSRWSTNYQIYIASIITYAGQINKSFNLWIEQDAAHVLIPYTSEGLDAWTTYYNDPSNEGIADFGSEAREWTLGNVYPFLFGDATMSSWPQERYNDMILNYSPVMFTDVVDRNQLIVSFKNVPLVDTIYILRSERGQGLRSYRFGFYDGTFTQYQLYTNEFMLSSNGNSVYAGSLTQIGSYNFDVINMSSAGTLQDLLNDAVYRTPVYFNFPKVFHNWYHGLTHVVLVDNLQTLANRQDVLNDYSLGLITDYDWINKPVDNGLPYWWKPIDFEIEIENPDGNLYPPGPGDLQPSIVNNTVINNYEILAPGLQINVPVDWFNKLNDNSDNYLSDTISYTFPFFALVGDIFECLGEIRIILLGILVLGLAAGVTSKFLL